MSMDTEIERHRQTWIGFTRFLTWGAAVVVITLALMAMFLLS